MSHTCHAHGCTTRIPPRLFACKQHWFMVPKPVRDAIWREYQEGQEVNKKPSLRYLAVQRLAVMYTAFKPHDEVAALACAGYLRDALVIANECKKRGLGDPLAGLLPEEP